MPQDKTPKSTALTVFADNASQPDKVKAGAKDFAEVEAKLRTELSKLEGPSKLGTATRTTLQTAVLGAVAATAVLVPGAPLVSLFYVGTVNFLFGMGYKRAFRRAADEAEDIYSKGQKDIYEACVKVQRTAYAGKKHSLVQLADKHLAEGGLIDMKALSYLATIDADGLKQAGASEDLAITVLQARQMISYMSSSNRSDEKRPMTYETLSRASGVRYTGKREKGRKLLLQFLMAADRKLPGDGMPLGHTPYKIRRSYRVREICRLNRTHDSMARGIFLAPFISIDKKRLEAVKNMKVVPKDIEVPVPPLLPVEGFADILAKYESEDGNPQLDFPAVRGSVAARPAQIPPPAF